MKPIVFHERNDGRLVRKRMIDEVHLCPRRDNQQRQTGTKSTSALSMSVSAIHTRQRAVAIAAATGACQRVGTPSGLIDDGTHLVVVPSIRIIVSNHDGRVFPFRPILEEIDYLHEKRLFV